jgi:peroxiredoxin
MQQIVDLQQSPEYQRLGIPLVSIAFDSLDEQAPEMAALGVDPAYILSDFDGSVSEAYGVLEWAVATGEPGHTFVLVGSDGRIVWTQDYGAQENGGRMYVPVEELVAKISNSLGAP